MAKLREQGAQVAVPRSRDYDLTRPGEAERLLADTTPSHVVHLAARVGGIGYNQVAPAPLYLDNLMMGTYVIEAARTAPSVDKTVLLGTVCSYPKFTPVPFAKPACGMATRKRPMPPTASPRRPTSSTRR